VKNKPIGLWILDGATAFLMAGALLVIFLFTPADATMGEVQKIFYFHIASGWAGLLALLVGMVAAVVFLARRNVECDSLSASAIEVGLLFSVITVVSGMIWARPIWLTWWTWDPRLTTMAILVLLYAAYFILRAGIENPHIRRRVAAVYAILGSLSVPLTFFSIRAFRSIHPVAIGSESSTPFLTSRMMPAFALSLAAFTCLLAAFIWHRFRLGKKMEKALEREVR
jgi:heme exporter protein C